MIFNNKNIGINIGVSKDYFVEVLFINRLMKVDIRMKMDSNSIGDSVRFCN